MSSKTTYDILKYGTPTPDRVREIITTYMEDRDVNGYYTEWEPFPVKGILDSEVMETHFFRVWVYYDNKYTETIYGLIPRYMEDIPAINKWAQVGQGVICVPVTGMTTDEVYTNFHEYYEELNKICLVEEYKRNWSEDE